MVCLTSLRTKYPPVQPKMNRRRALFVLTKIDKIPAWEQRKEAEKDTKFVELGKYLSEIRAGQYWRLENLKSFDEFLGTASLNRDIRLITSCPSTSICRRKPGASSRRLAGARDWSWRSWQGEIGWSSMCNLVAQTSGDAEGGI